MSTKSFFTVALIAALALPAAAQFDTNGPNAAMTVQGKTASVEDPTNHDLLVALPGIMNIHVDTNTNPNQGVIMLGATPQPTPGTLATPWGGALDIGTPAPPLISNAFIIGDGVALSNNPFLDAFFASNSAGDFDLDVTLVTALNGQRFAVQCIVADPTNPPFFFDNTEAADLNFVTGQQLNVQTDDDGQFEVPFVTGTFNFHGQNWTSVWIEGNGNVNFGGQNLHAASGFYVEGNFAWANDIPGIAANRADWNPAAYNINEGVLLEELGNGSARISWGDVLVQPTNGGMAHFGELDTNKFEITLQLDNGSNPNEGGFQISCPNLDESTLVGRQGLVGHTPGGAVVNLADRQIRSAVDVAFVGEAQLQEFRSDSVIANIGWDGTGSARNYVNLARNFHGAVIDFFPNPPLLVTGDQGYTSVPSGPAPQDDFTAIDVPSLAAAGGQTVTAFGSFFGFEDGMGNPGTITIDPTGANGGPFACGYLGVLDDTGISGAVNTLPNPGPNANRDGEAMQFITPGPLPSGPNTIEIISAGSGTVRTINIIIVPTGGAFTSYTLIDDGSVAHALIVPVDFYGITHNSVSICSNGQITFGPGTGDFQNTTADLFDGWLPGTQVPSVGMCAADFNNGGVASGATYEVTEDPMLSAVTISYNNQNHWDSNTPAGSFSATFGGVNGPGGLNLDFTNRIPSVGGVDVDGIVGVSWGEAVTAASNVDLSNGLGDGLANVVLGGYIPVATPESIAEAIPAGIQVGGGTGKVVYDFIETLTPTAGSFVIF